MYKDHTDARNSSMHNLPIWMWMNQLGCMHTYQNCEYIYPLSHWSIREGNLSYHSLCTRNQDGGQCKWVPGGGTPITKRVHLIGPGSQTLTLSGTILRENHTLGQTYIKNIPLDWHISEKIYPWTNVFLLNTPLVGQIYMKNKPFVGQLS